MKVQALKIRSYAVALGLTTAILCAGQSSGDPLPLGLEIQVNTYTTGFQGNGRVAVLASGNLVATFAPTFDSRSMRRFSEAGEPLSEDIPLVTNPDLLGPVTIEALPDGGFVLFWQTEGGTFANHAVYGRMFDPSGTPSTDSFMVNTYTTGSLGAWASAAVQPTGDFLVVWGSSGSPGDDQDLTSVQARLFRSDGEPVTGQFQVNTYTTYFQFSPGVAAVGEHDFMVSWGSFDDVPDFLPSVRVQKISADGQAIGDEMHLTASLQPTTSSGFGISPAADDGFVVHWPDIDGAKARRFDSTATPTTDIVTIAADANPVPRAASMTAGPFGDQLVFWRDSSTNNLFGRVLTPDLELVSEPMVLNSHTTGQRDSLAADVGPYGQLVAVWHDQETYGNDPDFSVQMRLFQPLPGPLPPPAPLEVPTLAAELMAVFTVLIAGAGCMLVKRRGGRRPRRDLASRGRS